MRRRRLLGATAVGVGSASLSGCVDAVREMLGTSDSCRPDDGRWCYAESAELDAAEAESVFVRERTTGATQRGSREVVSLDADSGDVQWSYGEARGQDGFTPLTVEDGVYFSSCGDQDCRRLHALSLDGETRWTRALDAGYDAPTVGGDAVFVGSDVAVVRSLGVADGATRWERRLQGTGPASITSVEDAVFATVSGSIVALDRADGSVRWHYGLGDGTDGAIVESAVADGVVYAVSYDRVVAVRNGELRWQHPFSADVQPAIHGIASGLLVVSVTLPDEFRLFAFDVESGERVWTTDRITVPPDNYDPQVELHRNFVYASGVGLRAFDLTSGKERWHEPIDGGPVQRLSIAQDSVSVDHAVLVQVGESTVAIVSSLGEELWRASVDGTIEDVTTGAFVYVATDDEVRALDVPRS